MLPGLGAVPSGWLGPGGSASTVRHASPRRNLLHQARCSSGSPGPEGGGATRGRPGTRPSGSRSLATPLKRVSLELDADGIPPHAWSLTRPTSCSPTTVGSSTCTASQRTNMINLSTSRSRLALDNLHRGIPDGAATFPLLAWYSATAATGLRRTGGDLSPPSPAQRDGGRAGLWRTVFFSALLTRSGPVRCSDSVCVEGNRVIKGECQN